MSTARKEMKMNTHLTHEANLARLDDLRHAGGRRAAHRELTPAPEPAQYDGAAIAIRCATPADAGAIRRLAALDSTSVPSGDMLLAVVDGELRAAIEVASGTTIADPFHRTADVVDLIAVRAARLRADAVRSSKPAVRRRLPRLARARS
jgi:hypothetical protein